MRGDQVIADTTSPLVLYESGFAPRWYVPCVLIRLSPAVETWRAA